MSDDKLTLVFGMPAAECNGTFAVDQAGDVGSNLGSKDASILVSRLRHSFILSWEPHT